MAGFHTYLQSHVIPFDSLDAVYFNQELFEKLDSESKRASVWMAGEWGVPQWVAEEWDNGKSDIVRNASRLAVAPTKSTALIMGGISEGINPDPAFIYTQSTAGGEMSRINPVLLEIMKQREVYDKKHVQEVIDKFGSVQHVDWLTDEEKKVFRSAFELDQNVLVRLAAQRGRWIDQWQSLNLFFSAEEDPKYIVDVHRNAFNDPNIIGMYYIYSKSGVAGSKECEVCQ